mgnify:CR=1 FL=1
MSNWFTIDRIDETTTILSEYRHWEETHCYLLEGTEKALLIDTGLGICDISAEDSPPPSNGGRRPGSWSKSPAGCPGCGGRGTPA